MVVQFLINHLPFLPVVVAVVASGQEAEMMCSCSWENLVPADHHLYRMLYSELILNPYSLLQTLNFPEHNKQKASKSSFIFKPIDVNTHIENMSREKKSTMGVCWNLNGHEGNISSVVAGLVLKKAGRNRKSRILRESANKATKIFCLYNYGRNFIIFYAVTELVNHVKRFIFPI